MKIENNELIKALSGALRTEEKDGALRMFRFTEKQCEYFAATENYIHKPMKSRATAGMNFDFYTDADSISIEAIGTRASGQSYCYIDVYVDGEIAGHFGFIDRETKKFSFSMELKQGRKRVAVYLPCLFGVEISNFELSDGAAFEPVKKDKKFMFFGDSITHGYITEYPSLSYPNIVSRYFDAECVNQGVGAGLFDANDLDEDFPYKPDKVFVAYGTNDWYHSIDVKITAKEYYEKLCRIFKDSKIYAIIPIWRVNYKEKEEITNMKFFDFREELTKICEQFENVTIIDGFELVPHDDEYFCEDGTHPNTKGLVSYGEQLVKKVLEND